MAIKRRTTAPDVSNKYYISNQFKGGLNAFMPRDNKTGWTLPNCTAYVFGRVYEFTGKRPTFLVQNWDNNAENWFVRPAKGYTYTPAGKNCKPMIGGIVCWRKGEALKGNDGAGHVAFIEDYDDKYVYLSESNYSGKAWQTRKVERSTMYLGAGYTFQGYITYPECYTKEQAKEEPKATEKKPASTKKSNTDIAREVIQGKWGNGVTRKLKLKNAGYNYEAVQKEVNRLLKK